VRATSGVPGLDQHLEGGFPPNRATLIVGEPGTGKSSMAMQFVVAGIEMGERGIFVSVDQKPRHVLEDFASFAAPLDKAAKDGRLTMLDASPFFTKIRNKTKNHVPVDAGHIATDLSAQISQTGAKRLAIDSFTSLVPPDLSRGQAHDFLRSLIMSLEDNLGTTIVLTCRSMADDPLGVCLAAQHLASGVIELRMRQLDGTYTRSLFVKKMRGTRVAPEEHPFAIDADSGLALIAARPAAPALSRDPDMQLSR
jgi:KaiC/GvpD/RAD55 family RecA-like ATPase